MPTAPAEPQPLAPLVPASARGSGGDAGARRGPRRRPPGARASGGPGTEASWGERALAWWPALLIAAILCFVAFLAGGGLNLGDMTTVEMTLTIGAGALVAVAVLLSATAGRAYGVWPVALLIAFAALTAVSVVWSVQPDDSFKDAGRMFAFCGVFGAAVVLARTVPARWPALLGGVLIAAAVVCGYAVLTKVFPNRLDASDIYARLRAPYNYWNAIGLTAAMGAMSCMWLGARRAGHALLSALAYPAMGLMLLTLMLAYSRGALVALALGLALWFCVVPLRLRGAAVLLSGAVAAGGVVAWDFKTHALSSDKVALAARTDAGHQLGVLVVAMLLVLAALGIAVGFWTGRRAPSVLNRRRAGALLLSLLVVLILAFFGALAASHRGLTGSISHGLHALTDPHAAVPANTPGRLTAVGSVRARYWNEALKVFDAHKALGAGAEGYATARLRYRTETLDVRHAHGYLVQTLADLGIVGLVLTLALLVAWMAAAGRACHPFNRRWTSWSTLSVWVRRGAGATAPGWRRLTVGGRAAPYTPERIAMLTMLCLVVIFGIHSLADWTWYVPGNACVALLCAGWLAGRGPLAATASAGALLAPDPLATADGAGPRGWRMLDVQALRARLHPRVLGPMRIAVAVAVLVGALLAAWMQWQPQRSSDASQQALGLLARDPAGARAAAETAVSRDPLSAQALFTLAAVQQARSEPALARATLQRAVRLQPSNPQTWLDLGEYDLPSNPREALRELGAAIYLNPESISPEAIAQGNPEAIAIQNAYIQASRAATAQEATARLARKRALRAAARQPAKRKLKKK